MSTLRVNTLTTTNGLYTGPVERLLRANILAWVNFDGTLVSTGLAGVRSQYNIVGVSDLGVGDYMVNFATSMPNSNYCVLVTVQESNGGSPTVNNGAFPQVAGATAPSTGSVRVYIKLNTLPTTAVDASRVYVAIVGP
jgi:hypothetical protein